jgi:hypothetical protein
VRYLPALASIQVSTIDAHAGVTPRGTIDSVTYSPGDIFGARVYRDGVTQVFRNRELVGEVPLTAWELNSSGGQVGIELDRPQGAVLDDFGGGTILSRSFSPPVAIISAPAESSFYATGDTVRLEGSAVDDNGTPRFRWQVDTHHNNHVHPGTFVSRRASDFFIGENHDDGTGAFLRANFIVTDGGLADSVFVDLFPRVDLTASEVTIVPSAPDSLGDYEYRFWIHNLGPMLAPYSRWVLQADGMEIAHGDTLVAGLDSVEIVSRDPPPAEGTHTLRLTVDSLRTVVETDESNNARVQTVTGPDRWAQLFVTAPMVKPLTFVAVVSWVAKVEGFGTVSFGTTPDLGDSVVAMRDTTVHRLLLRMLTPETRYYYMVSVADSLGNLHPGPVMSFITNPDTISGRSFELSAPFPTPSNGGIQFTVLLPHRGSVRMQVFDLQGRAIWIDDRPLLRGLRTLSWPGTGANGERVRPGLYFARVEYDQHAYVRRIILVP